MRYFALVLTAFFLLFVGLAPANGEENPARVGITTLDIGEIIAGAMPCRVFAVEGDVCGLFGYIPSVDRNRVEYRQMTTNKVLLSIPFDRNSSLIGRNEQASYDAKTGVLSRWVDCLSKPEEIAPLQLDKGLESPWVSAPLSNSSNAWWVLVAPDAFVLASRRGDRIIRLAIRNPGDHELCVSAKFAVAVRSGKPCWASAMSGTDHTMWIFDEPLRIANLGSEKPAFAEKTLKNPYFMPRYGGQYVGLVDDLVLIGSNLTWRDLIDSHFRFTSILYRIDGETCELNQVRKIDGTAFLRSLEPPILLVAQSRIVTTLWLEDLDGNRLRAFPDSMRTKVIDGSSIVECSIAAMDAQGSWIEVMNANGKLVLQRDDGTPSSVVDWDALRGPYRCSGAWVDSCAVFNTVSSPERGDATEKKPEIITILKFGKGTLGGPCHYSYQIPWPIG
ncbi:MAG: hypothetical protein WC712_12450 [Candidatus Brocadiia bacterium]